MQYRSQYLRNRYSLIGLDCLCGCKTPQSTPRLSQTHCRRQCLVHQYQPASPDERYPPQPDIGHGGTPTSQKMRMQVRYNFHHVEVINILLWVLLPLIFAAFILQMVFALIIDLMSAMFWSASTIIGWCWRKYDNLCWRIFVVCISPFLILAGLVAMPCVLNRLPNYRFLTQTRTEWYRARHMFPKEFHQWCPCCRL